MNGYADEKLKIRNEDGWVEFASLSGKLWRLQATLFTLYKLECEPVRPINSELWGNLYFKVCLENCFVVIVAWLPLTMLAMLTCVFPS